MNRTEPEQYSMMPKRSLAAWPATLLAAFCLAGTTAAFAQNAANAAGLIQITPAPLTPLSEAGQLERQGRYPEALEKIEKVVAADPEQARPRFLQGVILMRLERFTEAQAVFEKLREDFPELPEPYNNLGVIYLRQGKVQQAKESLEAAIQANAKYATAHENLGDLYAHLAAEAYARAGAQTKQQAIQQILRPPATGR